MLRKRQLDKDTVDGIVVVETADLIEELNLSNILWEVEQLAVNMGLETASKLVIPFFFFQEPRNCCFALPPRRP